MMLLYVENIIGFSKEAFYQAYNQGLEAGDCSMEMNLTRRTYKRLVELESRGNSIEMIMVGFEKTIILYGQGKYETLHLPQI